MKRVAYLGRLRKVFFFISLFAAAALVACSGLDCALLLGDRAVLIPVVVEGSDPLPPPGDLPFSQLIASLVVSGALVLAAIVWLLWLFSAIRLPKAANVERLHHGPFSAVALHFVPVVAYVMPMLIMAELERATRDPVQWRYLANSRLATTTWLVGKLSWIGFASSLNMQRQAETTAQYATSLWLGLVGAAGCLLGLYLFNRYLKHMEALQMALAARMEGLPVEGTP
jgi:hypothetical protein